ncbi:unnamed protein product [Trichobilharzia szidati]|nr:unnamed protein product [Trichobilharzia szidati]
MCIFSCGLLITVIQLIYARVKVYALLHSNTFYYCYLRNSLDLQTIKSKNHHDLCTDILQCNGYAMYRLSEQNYKVRQRVYSLPTVANKCNISLFLSVKLWHKYPVYIKNVMLLMCGLYFYVFIRSLHCYFKFTSDRSDHLSKNSHYSVDRSQRSSLLGHNRRQQSKDIPQRCFLPLVKLSALYAAFINCAHKKINCFSSEFNCSQSTTTALSPAAYSAYSCSSHRILLMKVVYSILNKFHCITSLRPYETLKSILVHTKHCIVTSEVLNSTLINGIRKFFRLYNYWKCLYKKYSRFRTKRRRRRRRRKRSKCDDQVYLTNSTNCNHQCFSILSQFYLLFMIINSVFCISKYSKQNNLPLLVKDFDDLSLRFNNSSNDIIHNTYNYQARTIYHFKPPDEKRPCRYRFRDDAETSALLADYVIVGQPVQTYRRRFGPLYNVSLMVTHILKSVQHSIFPVRENHLLRVGQFSIFPDPGRCWINVHRNKKYIFFLRQPDWSGFCKITQLPLEYTKQAYRAVKEIMRLGADPLYMGALHHKDVLHVNEGNDLLLTCSVLGRPTPIISWFVNQTEIKNPWKIKTGRGIIQKSRCLSKLQLSNVHTSDSANYTCVAENLNGDIHKSVQVIVRPTTTLPPPTTTTTNLFVTPEVTTVVPVHPCIGYCHQGQCYMIDGKPYCSCISQYRGARCDLFTPGEEDTPLEQLTLNEPKSDPCESGCESNFARVLLFSAIGVLLLLLLFFFICSIFQICYKKRQSSNKTCPPVEKSSVCEQDVSENNVSKSNHHATNLPLPKVNNTQSSKVFLNPLFDTDLTRELSTKSMTMAQTNGQNHCNTDLKFNYNNDYPLTHDQSLSPFFSPNSSFYNITSDYYPKNDENPVLHKNLSVPSIVELLTNIPALQNQTLYDSFIAHSGKLPQKVTLTQIPYEPVKHQQQQEEEDTELQNPNQLTTVKHSIFPDKSTSRLNSRQTACSLSHTTSAHSSHPLKSSKPHIPPDFGYYQQNYVSYSNIDSIYLNTATTVRPGNDEYIVNWNNTDSTINVNCLDHCHYSALMNTTPHKLGNLLHNTTVCNNPISYYSAQTLPLTALTRSQCVQSRHEQNYSPVQLQLDSNPYISDKSCQINPEIIT